MSSRRQGSHTSPPGQGSQGVGESFQLRASSSYHPQPQRLPWSLHVFGPFRSSWLQGRRPLQAQPGLWRTPVVWGLSTVPHSSFTPRASRPRSRPVCRDQLERGLRPQPAGPGPAGAQKAPPAPQIRRPIREAGQDLLSSLSVGLGPRAAPMKARPPDRPGGQQEAGWWLWGRSKWNPGAECLSAAILSDSVSPSFLLSN